MKADRQYMYVWNKKQLMAALWAADDAHVPSSIFLLPMGTIYDIPAFTDLKKVRGKLRRTPAHVFRGEL